MSLRAEGHSQTAQHRKRNGRLLPLVKRSLRSAPPVLQHSTLAAQLVPSGFTVMAVEFGCVDAQKHDRTHGQEK
jgi:hypothetical protein